MGNNQVILLKQQSEGIPKPTDFETGSRPQGELSDGQLACETLYLSLDPYLRGKISGRHMSGSVSPGDIMAGEAVSRVLASKDENFVPGDLVQAHSGWQSHPIINGKDATKLPDGLGPESLFLGILGMPGLTAYAGLLRLGEPKAGDTLVVSAATGPVGSTVAQIGKIKGCTVVGVAGSPEKCAWLTETAGMDHCINYKQEDLREALKRCCPNGIDVYFDNVGGDMLQAVMEQLALGARVVLCGLMAQYNESGMPPGPNPAWTIKARATVRGMVVYDHEDLRSQMQTDISNWIKEGKIQYLEDMTEGLENAADAFCRLMQGKNFGKAIVKVS